MAWVLYCKASRFLYRQEIQDARQIRDRIVCNFELASQRNLPEDEVNRLLHIVIVGGGPTGVEFGAELYDFFRTVRDAFITWKLCVL